MSELSLSPNAIQVMKEAGWDYYPTGQWFEYAYYQCSNRAHIAYDLSDYTGYDVSCNDTSIDKGYWYVSLNTDDQCFDFAKKYDEWHEARQRISHAFFVNKASFNRTLVLTQEQYDKVAKMVDRYDKKIVGDHYLIAIPQNETTKRIIAILDALGI
jgi:hypothetical protein